VALVVSVVLDSLMETSQDNQAVQVATLVAVELAARFLSNQVAAEARTSAR
jgi:hypothetical protein